MRGSCGVRPGDVPTRRPACAHTCVADRDRATRRATGRAVCTTGVQDLSRRPPRRRQPACALGHVSLHALQSSVDVRWTSTCCSRDGRGMVHGEGVSTRSDSVSQRSATVIVQRFYVACPVRPACARRPGTVTRTLSMPCLTRGRVTRISSAQRAMRGTMCLRALHHGRGEDTHGHDRWLTGEFGPLTLTAVPA